MVKLNLLNRLIRRIFLLIEVILKVAGASTFIYNSQKKIFVRNKYLGVHSKLLFFFGTFVTNFLIITILRRKHTPLTRGVNQFALKLFICSVARIHQLKFQHRLIAILNEYLEIMQEIRILARHPNIFRFKHFVLVLFALQSMLRSWSLIEFFVGLHLYYLIFMYTLFVLTSVFIVTVTSMLLMFITLIACYDELHRCTRRISNDVRTLRLSQTMSSGQRTVLIEQLSGHLGKLITLRSRMFSTTVRLMKFFRFHLLMAVLYWLAHIFFECINNAKATDLEILYHIWIALMNLTFYFTIFELFMWISKLSRSFWSFHLVNYNSEFDEMVDTLVHRELFENIKVTAYGLRLDMKFFFRIVKLVFLYILVRFVFKKI